VAYGSNISQTTALIREAVVNHPRVIKDPPPVIGISEFGDSGINIWVGPWVAVKDYVAATAELNQLIYERLAGAKITIPFPQREIRILNESLPMEAAQGK
jgi:small conductance mechanosensitive channel